MTTTSTYNVPRPLPNQVTAYAYTRLSNGIRINADFWWLLIGYFGIEAVDQLMMEPDYYMST